MPMERRSSIRKLCFASVVAAFFIIAPAALAQGSWAIYAMNADGSDVVNVTRSSPGWFGAPFWSNDGKQLTYHGVTSGAGFKDGRIFVHNLGETAPRDLGPGTSPSFSPDDQQIAFSVADFSSSRVKRGVWVMNADGQNREWISEGERPRWSRDGEKLVFVGTFEGFPSLYVYDTATLERTRVLAPGYEEIVGGSFSPDGKRLAFVGYKGGRVGKNSPNGELVLVDAQDGAMPEVVLRGRIGFHPDWSPVANKLLFYIADEAAVERLHTLDLDGAREPVSLPGQSGKVNRNAVWSADGKRIAFGSDRGN